MPIDNLSTNGLVRGAALTALIKRRPVMSDRLCARIRLTYMLKICTKERIKNVSKDRVRLLLYGRWLFEG